MSETKNDIIFTSSALTSNSLSLCFYLFPSFHFSLPLCISLYLSLSLSGSLIVTVEDPIPPPPISSSSSSSSSSSPADRWTAESSRPRGSVPNRNARIPPRTDLPLDTQSPFVWRRGGLTECTASCGKGQSLKNTWTVGMYVYMCVCLDVHVCAYNHSSLCVEFSC